MHFKLDFKETYKSVSSGIHGLLAFRPCLWISLHIEGLNPCSQASVPPHHGILFFANATDVVNRVLPPCGWHIIRNGADAKSDVIPAARWRPRVNNVYFRIL